MTEREVPDESYAGGLVSLQMAEAHLNVHLASIDSVDSKAMFLVGLNAAVVSGFVAILAASSQPLGSVVAPGLVAIIAAEIGGGQPLATQRRSVSSAGGASDLPSGWLRQRRAGMGVPRDTRRGHDAGCGRASD